MPPVHEALSIALDHHRAGRLNQAEAAYRKILAFDPAQAAVWHLLGTVAAHTQRPELALGAFSRAVALEPAHAAWLIDLGNAFLGQRQHHQALAAYDRAAASQPYLPEVHFNRGLVFDALGQLESSIDAYRTAVRLRPDYPAAQNNLGNALKNTGQFRDAVACFQNALRIQPDFALAHCNLGNVLIVLGLADEAEACYRRALLLQKDYTEAYSSLGTLLVAKGRLDEALAYYRQAIALRPSYAEAHSNLIYALHLHPRCDDRTLGEELDRWSRQHAQPLKPSMPHHANAPDPRRRLRIGYVSADLRLHAVGRFLLPLLAAHDRQAFAIYAYADVTAKDSITAQLQSHTDQWRDIAGMSDQAVAELITQDEIDILVDLSMHTAGNRLLVFARKPAPVQVTYLAYCSTTGLDTIDYRLSDPYLDPPGEVPPHYREQTILLPESYWCYRPTIPTPEVNELPALSGGAAGHITLGCLNNFAKLTDEALATWAQIMQALPHSRLILHAHVGNHRQRVIEVLSHAGISADRLEFTAYLPLAEYYRTYQKIDLALDTFSYAGGTTTCDALWMGVPVITLRGPRAIGRGGVSVLSNAGLPELIATSREQYVTQAVALASDLPRLAALRRLLRPRLQASPLMNAPRFAQNIETAYRDMWQHWCDMGR